MFGDRFFGPRFFGNRYFGDGGAPAVASPGVGPVSWTFAPTYTPAPTFAETYSPPITITPS